MLSRLNSLKLRRKALASLLLLLNASHLLHPVLLSRLQPVVVNTFLSSRHPDKRAFRRRRVGVGTCTGRLGRMIWGSRFLHMDVEGEM